MNLTIPPTIPKKSEICIGVDVLPMLAQLVVIGDVSPQPISVALHEIIASGHYSLKPRFMLEKSTTELHFIPYIRIVNQDRSKVMIYQRPDREDGESRLNGNFSVGIGGHPDSKSPQYAAHVLALFDSMRACARDEFLQEIRVHQPCTPSPETEGWDDIDITERVLSTLTDVGFIYDPSDSVGLNHMAVLFETVAPDDAFFKAASPTEVRDPKFVDSYDAIREYDGGLENWSRLWIKHSNKTARQALAAATNG